MEAYAATDQEQPPEVEPHAVNAEIHGYRRHQQRTADLGKSPEKEYTGWLLLRSVAPNGLSAGVARSLLTTLPCELRWPVSGVGAGVRLDLCGLFRLSATPKVSSAFGLSFPTRSTSEAARSLDDATLGMLTVSQGSSHPGVSVEAGSWPCSMATQVLALSGDISPSEAPSVRLPAAFSQSSPVFATLPCGENGMRRRQATACYKSEIASLIHREALDGQCCVTVSCLVAHGRLEIAAAV